MISIVQAFKEARADPNITNADGITPWQTAMLEGHARVAKRLVEMGAHRNHRFVDDSCQLCGVYEGQQSAATDCEGAIRADRVRLTTIFEHWHPGKLVLFWVMCWVGALLSVNTGILIVDFAGETPVTISLALGAWFLATLLVVTPFVVTWRWFTAREKETDKPPDGTP